MSMDERRIGSLHRVAIGITTSTITVLLSLTLILPIIVFAYPVYSIGYQLLTGNRPGKGLYWKLTNGLWVWTMGNARYSAFGHAEHYQGIFPSLEA